MIRLALQSSLQVDRIIDQYPGSIRLPREAAEELITHGFTYLNTCTLLANRYNVAGDMIFNVTVKAHFFAHILLRSRYLNPRRAWCFSGERFMLIMRKLTASCVRGITLKELSGKLLTKYRHGLSLALSENAEWVGLAELEAAMMESECIRNCVDE